MAKPAVAESRVALEMDEPEVAVVLLPKGKKRRLTVESDGGESGDDSEVMTGVPVEEERGVILGVDSWEECRGVVGHSVDC